MFTKYFADATYDGEQGSFEAARSLRDEILSRIKADPVNAKKIMAEYQEKYAKKPKD